MKLKIIVTDANGVRYNAIDATTVAKGVGADAKVLKVDFVAGATAIANGTYTVQLQAGAISDVLGNLSSAATTTITVGDSSDTTKPDAVLNGSSAVNKFVVDFGEEVTSSALNLANYKLDGAALPAGTVVYFNSTNKNSVTIELPVGSVNIGSSTLGTNAVLNVAGVADKAGNLSVSENLTVLVGDNTAATITAVQVIGQDVYVTFSENLTASTADADLAFDITVNGVAVTSGNMATVAGNSKQVKFTLDASPATTPVVKVEAGQSTLKDANGVSVK